MNDINEVTIFEEGKVKITNLRAIIGTNTYAMSNITSVSRKKREPGNAHVWWIVVGILLSLIGLVDFPDFLWSLVIGLIIVVAGIIASQKAKTTYIVKIGSASGESNVLESYDRDYIKRIVEAVNEAIVHRG